jgi:hypothetical protein
VLGLFDVFPLAEVWLAAVTTTVSPAWVMMEGDPADVVVPVLDVAACPRMDTVGVVPVR